MEEVSITSPVESLHNLKILYGIGKASPLIEHLRIQNGFSKTMIWWSMHARSIVGPNH